MEPLFLCRGRRGKLKLPRLSRKPILANVETKREANTGEHVMLGRYAKGFRESGKITEPLSLLVIIDVVPVVGLEPTRLFSPP